MKKSLLLKIVSVIFVVVGLVGSANAQVTTSSMVGTVKDLKETLPGASIKATHTPTGSVYTVVTNSAGRFSIGNMRVGGPYTVEVSFVGFKTKKLEDVYVKLGEAFVLNITLEDNSSTLNTVTIVGAGADPIMNSRKSGANTVVSAQQIQVLPTISRSVNDITRLTPQSNGSSIGGGNYRSNNFSVDGANFNNQFGIGQNIPANGSPISIDALEQISINVTPFDVRQTGFTGGSVNAVTKSGSNKFFGSGFFTMRTQDHQGRKIGDYTIPSTSVQALDEKNYGFSLGGPIVKDKLFFFVNAEIKKTDAPGTTRTASTPSQVFGAPGTPSTVARPTAQFLDEVKNYLLSTYNYDPGTYQGYKFKSNNDKLFARLDWNINNNHKFNVRYSQVKSKTPLFGSSSTTGSGVASPYSYAAGRTAITALNFSSANYYQDANLYAGTAELNSLFGSKFSNTLRFAYANQNDPRSSDSAPFPLVDISDGNVTGSNIGMILTTFGYEPFTYGNLRDVKTYTYSDELSANFGKHNLLLGVQAEFSTTKNGFQRFGTGFYSFRSWNDFITNQRPAQYSVTYSLNADGSQAYPSFSFRQYSAYLQDEFSVSDRFKLTAGIRLEHANFPMVDEIKTHPMVAALSFANGEKVDTGVLPGANISFSPRLGFNWNMNGDRTLQLRGGTGIFTGRIPYVWLVSQSGDAGMLQFTQTYSGNNTPFFNPSIAPNLTTPKGAAGTSIPGGISIMDKNLKMPQSWKSSLAIDAKLPGGIVASLEGIYTKDLRVAFGRNLNLKNPNALNISGYGDNRPMFPNDASSTSNSSATHVYARQIVSLTQAGQVTTTPNATNNAGFNVIKIENVKGGYNWMVTAQLSKQFSNGLSAMIAYTKTDQRNYGDQAGDQIQNLWSLPQTSFSANVPSLSYSGNLNPDRFIASLSYKKEYFKNLATSISVFYEGSQQGRFSYTYSSDFNRDGQSNDLIYIPRDNEIAGMFQQYTSGGVTFTAAQQEEAFLKFINQDKYLSERKGKYAERNGVVMPWRNQFDLRIVQEVFRNVGKTKNSVQFTADIFNFGNLLNKNWGGFDQINSSAILQPQNQNLVSNTVKPVFRMALAEGKLPVSTYRPNQSIGSTYYMQFGIRYNFQ
ncbi:TonB-dependent receptor [Pedobacter sp. SL55]|uniref:TonB-dependent receptor n=1 Tax=Pedobacter sp. SL55 TaxID=2995161 RepID=UPI002271B700|nr:carboxypeptidase regulatory-like domain-containing protein [Pedobacter sp. SL55]WAC39808.1 TonB-dependent receptor [Pedobacter sp. SL55]